MDDDSTHELPPSDATRASRRRFLARASAIGSAAIVGMVGVPVLRAFISPGVAAAQGTPWIKVADDIGTLDIGTPIKLDFIEERSDAWIATRTLRTVWIRTEDGATFTAFSGVCTHLGCSYFFEAEKKIFHCPCHHGLFDGTSGKVVGGPPPRGLDTVPVKVEEGALFVQYQSFLSGVPDKTVV